MLLYDELFFVLKVILFYATKKNIGCLLFGDTNRHKCGSVFVTYLIPKRIE